MIPRLISLEALGVFVKGTHYFRSFFIFVIEALSRMLDTTAILGQFSGFLVGNAAGTLLTVSHLLFVDDTLIFYDADSHYLAALRGILARL